MIKSITFKDNVEFSLNKESQKRWGYKKHKPTKLSREKKPWETFSLFKKGLSIEFKPEINIVVGENGSGKSTLFSLVKYYVGNAPDKLELSFSGFKTIEEYMEKYREKYSGELIVDGDLNYKNAIFFDAEKDNPIVDIPKNINPHNKNLPTLAYNLFNAQEESHGESMIPILKFILENAKNCVIFMDEPETALSLKNQIWLSYEMIKSAKDNGNQIIASTHALAIIQQFDTIFDMETRKWVSREKYISDIISTNK